MATNAAVGTTKKLLIPTTYLPTIYDKIKQNAVIPSLITQKPRLYNNDEMVFVTERPKAQYVGEGEGKASSDWGFEPKPMQRFKLQTTIRMTEETEFGDEDSSLELLDYVFEEMGNSLGEGVDSGMIHAVDPFSGVVMSDAKKVAIAKQGTQVTATSNLQADVDALPDSIFAAGHNVNGIALDNLYANTLRKERNEYTGARLYPDIPLTLDVGSFEGLKAVTSANVSGRSFGLDTGIQAIIGDWNMAQWGIIREMSLRKFDVGDPDNRGYDLSYKNEVAYRVEMLFLFGLVYEDAFAVLRSKADSDAGGDDGDDNSDDNSGTETQAAKAAKTTK